MTHFQWMILTLIVTFFLEVGILYAVNYSCVNRIISRAIYIFHLYFFKHHSFLLGIAGSVKKNKVDTKPWFSTIYGFQLMLSGSNRLTQNA